MGPYSLHEEYNKCSLLNRFVYLRFYANAIPLSNLKPGEFCHSLDNQLICCYPHTVFGLFSIKKTVCCSNKQINRLNQNSEGRTGLKLGNWFSKSKSIALFHPKWSFWNVWNAKTSGAKFTLPFFIKLWVIHFFRKHHGSTYI